MPTRRLWHLAAGDLLSRCRNPSAGDNEAVSSGESIDLGDKLGQFTEYWSPKVVGRLNDYEIKVVKLSGEFVWHSHTDTDELFLVVKGELDIQMRDRTVTLGPGQLFVVPAVSSTARSRTAKLMRSSSSQPAW